MQSRQFTNAQLFHAQFTGLGGNDWSEMVRAMSVMHSLAYLCDVIPQPGMVYLPVLWNLFLTHVQRMM